MSAYGRGGRRLAPGGPPSAVWSLLVIAAALIGGLAGAEIEHTSLIITLIVSLAVGVIAVLAVARWPGRPEELTDGRPEGRGRDLPGRPPFEPARPESGYARADPERTRVAPPYTGADPRYGRPEPGHPGPEPGHPGPEPGHPGPEPGHPGPEPGHPRPGIPARTESVVEVIPFSSRRDAPGAPPQGASDWWLQPAAPPPPASSAGRPAPAPDLSTYLDSAVIAQCPRCGAFDLDVDHGRDPWAFQCRACNNKWAWRPGVPWPEVRVAPRLRKESRPPSP